MKRKNVLFVVVIITIILIAMIYIFSGKVRYNKLVVSENDWNKTISERRQSTDLKIERLVFNDYPLIVDQKNNCLYYAMMDSFQKNNPMVEFEGNEPKGKIMIQEKLEEARENISIMIYNDSYYKIYTLKIKNHPLINIEYNKLSEKRSRAEVLILDNNIKSQQKIVKTVAYLIPLQNQEYSLSFRTESLGRNERKNEISIFGMEKEHEFRLIKQGNREDIRNTIELFLNSEYQGVYQIEPIRREGE